MGTVKITIGSGNTPAGYIAVKEAAKKWGISEHTVRTWRTRGKLNEAISIGRMLYVPANMEKPKPKSIGRPVKRRLNHVDRNAGLY